VEKFQRIGERGGVRKEFDFPPDCPLCIHVGRFVPAKNHTRLIDIFSKLSAEMPQARLLMAGRHRDEEITAAVREKIQSPELEDKVVMPGERTDIPRLLGAADLMIFPSVREGLPGAVLEAGASGLPVLASEVGGTSEIASRLPLVECLPLDADDARWATRAEALINTDRDTREQAQNSFTDTEFTVENCAKKFCGIWRQAADGRE
jgi:glycosyltransferase involved in cell wall biosynthesis